MYHIHKYVTNCRIVIVVLVEYILECIKYVLDIYGNVKFSFFLLHGLCAGYCIEYSQCISCMCLYSRGQAGSTYHITGLAIIPHTYLLVE